MPNLMFVGKAGAYPSEAPFRLARDKQSRLLRKLITYGRKKFYRIGPKVSIRTKLVEQLEPSKVV